jgi:hypothetical protein
MIVVNHSQNLYTNIGTIIVSSIRVKTHPISQIMAYMVFTEGLMHLLTHAFQNKVAVLSSSFHPLFLGIMTVNTFFLGREIYYLVIVQFHSYLLLVK